MDKVILAGEYFKALLSEPIFNSDYVLIARARVLGQLDIGAFDNLSSVEFLNRLKALTLHDYEVFHGWQIHRILNLPVAIPFDPSIEFDEEDYPFDD